MLTIELRIPGDLSFSKSLRKFAGELAEYMGFPLERVRNIELATDEIFNNAVEHGSDGLKSEIKVKFQLKKDVMRVVISDPGATGKSINDWINRWYNTIKESTYLETERGHGLFVAYNLSDEMHIELNSHGGANVYLVWHKEDFKGVGTDNGVELEPQAKNCIKKYKRKRTEDFCVISK